MFEEFTSERMCLLVTVALPGPNYNNAFPPELKITSFPMFLAQKSQQGRRAHAVEQHVDLLS